MALGLQFYRSSNGVICCPGPIPVSCFLRVVRMSSGSLVDIEGMQQRLDIYLNYKLSDPRLAASRIITNYTFSLPKVTTSTASPPDRLGICRTPQPWSSHQTMIPLVDSEFINQPSSSSSSSCPSPSLGCSCCGLQPSLALLSFVRWLTPSSSTSPPHPPHRPAPRQAYAAAAAGCSLPWRFSRSSTG